MRLADDDIRGVLARAEEIQRSTLHGGVMHAELEAVIQAAEQVGISRPAVERALRERLNLPIKPPAVGDLVFARSADQKFYVAEVLSTSQEGVHVRFLRGSEHTVSLDELRPCSFLPGERVVVPWPWWGPWTCNVVNYDAANRQVAVSDGWSETRTFPIEQVWLNAPRKFSAVNRTRMRVYATLIGAGAAVGAIIGSILMRLLLG